jgi:O-antigen ligase
MISSYAAIFFLGFALAWSAVNKAGVPPFDSYVSLVFIGAALIAYWGRQRRAIAPPLKSWVRGSILGVMVCGLFQLLPLPLSILALLSPARAELARSLSPVLGSVQLAPISLNPPNHLLWLLTIAGALAVFFLIRELASRFPERPGMVLFPLFAVAIFEAALGLIQVAGGAVQATGTYNGRDHYVCILELVLPLTIGYGFAVFSRRSEGSALPVIAAAGVWFLAAVQLLAIVASLSRAGILDTFISLVAVALLLLLPRLPSVFSRVGLLAALLVAVAILLLFLSPSAMLQRLAETDTQSEGRFTIWREAAPLLSEFRWFGTGLLGFDPAFLKYQAMANAHRIDFAHNDYLQYLIELGLIGFLPLIAASIGIIWPIAVHAWSQHRMDRRFLLIGCAAGILALAVHSAVDFNLYVPANMLVFAWIAGFGSLYAYEK